MFELTTLLTLVSIGLLAIGMVALGKDINSLLVFKHAIAQTSATAGGAGDNTAINGTSFDLRDFAGDPQSVSFAIDAEATLAASETLTVKAKIQKSSDNSTWSDLVAEKTILTLDATGSGVGKIGADLTKGDRYVRCVVTPDLSASATDTAKVAGIAVFGGLSDLPQ